MRRLLSDDGTPSRGRVVRVRGERVEVATRRGLGVYLSGGALHVGQSVRLDRGTAYPSARVPEDRVYAL